jgi:2',3'-cyclic-nucleotide 2'-phosphodiesterase/3'-nucleotidase/5'-nucleotidase
LKRGIKPIEKRLYVDLVAAGYHNVQKVEGLAWIDEDTIAVVNDNDFGVGRISIEGSTGRFTLLPDYRPEPVMLGVISRKRGK